MIQEITETGFNSGVTLNSATVNLTNMGERTITADVKIAGGASLGENAELTFRGEKFVPVVKDPQAVKNNERVAHVVSVTFQSYVIAELKRYWFFKTPEQGSDIVVDTYKYQIGLNLSDFVALFNQVLSHYYGEEIVMDASAIDMSEHTEAELIDIDYTTIWEVLTQIYEKYKVRWKIAQSNGVYTIVLSNEPDTLQHVFSYGYDGGLTSIERQVQNEDIHNKIFGRGVDTNLPPFYFKRLREGDTSGYQSDPDALYELKYIEFTELRDATFRWYVRGWMQNENRDRTWENNEDPLYTEPYFYPTYQESDIPAQPVELHDSCLLAFRAGKTDDVFSPIEYVKDDTSIARYGELWGKAEPDEDIYPTIKTPIVAYENTTPDEVSEVTAKESRNDTLNDATRAALVYTKQYYATKDLVQTAVSQGNKKVYTGVLDPAKDEVSNGFDSEAFSVDEGMACTPTYNVKVQFGYWNQKFDPEAGLVGPILGWVDKDSYYIGLGYTLTYNKNDSYFYAKDADTGEYLTDTTTGERVVSPIAIPAGRWKLEFHIKVTQVTPPVDPANFPLKGFRVDVWDIKLNMHVQGASPYRLFDIWIGNAWNTQKGLGETDEEYVRRVWAPVLGTSQEASVYFATGMLARSSDYDFKIAGPLLRGVAYDTSKEGSHWRLTLIKSEAEYQADGMFIPREGIEPAAGDLIAFSDGTIVYPHALIEDAEQRVNAHKIEVLKDCRDIQPAWAVKLDKVRINTLASGEAATLYSLVDVGRKITISSDTLIPDGDHTRSMFIEAMTITWNDDTVAKPDVDITLSDEIRVYRSPIKTLQSGIRTIEVTKVDEEQAEGVASRTAARESIPSTGRAAARAAAPLELANMLQSPDFRTGLLEGEGWSIYRDTFGNCVIEADKVIARQGVSAPSIEIDEWKHQGGVQILSAANMRISSVTDADTVLRCFFDSKGGSIVNLFREHDIVLCNRVDETTGETKVYRYEVVGIGETYVELSKTNHVGDTAAAGDELIQFGNTTDVNRQHAIIFDAASGHERMLFGLNSINATGDVYYYAGAIQQNGTERRRWFVGDRDNSKENFIEYAWNETTQSYALVIGGDVYVGGSEVSLDALNYLAAALRDGGQAGGLILSNQIAVYTGTGQQAQIMGGINGNATTSQIAAWFGGAMTTEGQTAAKVVFKFDGSGYVAAKHISWDAAGNCTIDGTVQLASGGTVGDLLTLVQGAVQRSELISKGTHIRPVYFDANGAAQVIDGLDVPENIHTQKNVEAGYGVAAYGMASLAMNGGGGQGTVTAINFEGSPEQIYTPSDGLITLPDYPSLDGYATQAWVTNNFADKAFEGRVTAIESKIPAQASSTNQLADKNFVNSSVATATAEFQGTYDVVEDLGLSASATHTQIQSALLTAVASKQPDNNDYVFVSIPAVGSASGKYERYKFNGTAWAYEYTLNNSSFTAAQWASITSGITSAKVLDYDTHIARTDNPHGVTKAQVGLGNVENTALSTWTGTIKIVTLGTITTGVWHGSAIADDYIASASAWNAKYDKDPNGIPKTDLASAVQTSLGKADTALQSESDPVFTASAAYGITSANINEWNAKQNALAFDGTYDASTNKVATKSTVTNAINALDVSNISGFGAGKTLASLTEADGKIAATFQNISITKSQVSDFPTTWALANITGADDLKAIEALTGTSGFLKKTAANKWALDTDVASGTALSDVSTRVGDLEGYFDANGVANSAAKLNTAHNLWGQSFNGSADVNGDIAFSSASMITCVDSSSNAVNLFQYTSNNIFRLGYGQATKDTLNIYGKAVNIRANGLTDGVADAYIKVANGGTVDIKGTLSVLNNASFAGTATIASHITSTNGNIQALNGGVSASGIASLAMNGGGGQGTLTQIQVNGVALADTSGVVNITATTGNAAGKIAIAGQQIPVYGLGSFAYLSSLAFTDLSSHPTTLGGYGITDAKIANGVITLGGNTITPITSLPTFYNLAFQNASGTTVDTYKPTTSPSKTIKAGSNVTISASSNVITIAATDTTYESKAAASGGTAVSLVTTGEKYTWNNKQNAISDLATIRSNASNGNTAYGWGNHADAGYFAASSFTKANIKSTLGISDWALAASKPSYAFSEITGTVTNAQLAGSIANNKLASAGKFTIGSTAIELGTTYTAANFRSYLGLGGAATYGATSSVTDGGTSLVTSGGVYSYVNALLTAAMKIEGETTTAISDGSTTNPVTIGGQSVNAYKGMVVFYGSKEFVWVGTAWKELGDESSFALKTTTVSGTGYLTGGGALSSNQTIDIASSVKTNIDNGATAYGWGNHANEGYVKAATDDTISGLKTFSHGIFVQGRVYNSGDDEGIVIKKANNGYAGVTLIKNSIYGIRTTFYLNANDKALWVYNNGTTSYSIYHPEKSGTIALTTDIPTKLSDFTDDLGTSPTHTHSQYAIAANLGTASTHAHEDYVTAIGVSGNTLTWSKGGTAQTAITVPYATAAGKLNTNAGSATNPVYFANGVPVACTYSLNKTVPADAVFTDTNTHRPIQLNGTEILGNNTTALNLKAGTNVSLSNSNGTVTIAATDTTYSANNGVGLSGTTFYNSGVRAATINGNYLRINTNGTNADLTIPYATNANYAATAGSAPASDVYAWAKAASKPSYHAGELGVTPTSYKVTSVAAGIAPYISDIGTNIFSGATTSEITVERSLDNGATWTDVTSSEAANVKNVFSGCVSGDLVISGHTKAVVGDRLRITFNPSGGSRYCQLAFIYVYFSTNGCGCLCNIEKNLYTDKTAWTTYVADAPMAGWSGPNIVGMGGTIFGQGDSRNDGYGLRFTFRITSVNANYDSRGYIRTIQGFTANKAWGTPSGNSIAKTNTPYTYVNADRAVSFDNTVAAIGFYENGTALSSKYLGISAKAADSDKLDGNDSSYFAVKKASAGSATNPIYTDANGVFQACTYSLNKTVPSDALFTDANVTQEAVTASSYTNWRTIPFGYSNGGSETFGPSTVTNQLYTASTLLFQPSTGTVRAGIFKSTVATGTAPLVIASTTRVANLNADLLDGYEASALVKYDGGAAEQTIKSSISSLSKGVINLWRNSGDHYTFLGFSNGTTETYLGGIGFKSQNDHNLYRKDGSNYYKIWDENNDGADSGLNADLLDGQHGSYYAVKAASKGSTTKPIYTDANGAFQECSTYAGGTAVTLNGTSKAASTASFYAPTGAGTSGQILKSSGSGAPTWVNQSTITAGALTTTSKTAWGQTFWTSDGIPATISGNMTNVGNIAFSASGKNIGGTMYFDTTNHRIGINDSTPSCAFDVTGDVQASGGIAAGGILNLAYNGAGTQGTLTQIQVNGRALTDTSGIVNIPLANTTSTGDGAMSHSDKLKLDGIATGATNVNTDTVAGWGYTKNAGTVTGVKMNGSVKGSSGVVDLGTVITDVSGKADKQMNVLVDNNGSATITMTNSTTARYHFVRYPSSSSVTAITLQQATSALTAANCGTAHYELFKNEKSTAITLTLTKYSNSSYYLIAPSKTITIPANSSVELSYIHIAGASSTFYTVVTIGDVMINVS